MAECGYCGVELAPDKQGPRRKYCCAKHRSYAHLLRKAEALVDASRLIPGTSLTRAEWKTIHRWWEPDPTD